MEKEIIYNDEKPKEEKEVKTFIELKEKILKNAEKIKNINIISEKFSKEELALAMLCENFKYKTNDNFEIISSEDVLKYENKNVKIYGDNFISDKIEITLPFVNKEERKRFKELNNFLKLLEKKEQNFKIEICEKEDWIKATFKVKDNFFPFSVSTFSTDNVCFKIFSSNEKIFNFKYKNKEKILPNISKDFGNFSLDETISIENEENFLQIDNNSKEISLFNNVGRLLFFFYIENNKIILYDKYQILDIEKQIKYFNNILNMLKTLIFYIREKDSLEILEKNLKLISEEIIELTKKMKKKKNDLKENENKYINILKEIENFKIFN